MTPQQFLAKIKAYPLALSLLGAAILLAGWAYYRSSGALVDATAALDQAMQDNDRYNTNAAAGEKIDDHLAELASDGKKLKDALINTTTTVLNEQYFYDVGKPAGVTIGDPTQGATEPHKDTTVPSVTAFQLTANGHWNNIASFLYGLQTGPHLLRVSHFRLSKTPQSRSDTGDNNRLDLTLSVEVLGQ
jgi:hypothetical protein